MAGELRWKREEIVHPELQSCESNAQPERLSQSKGWAWGARCSGRWWRGQPSSPTLPKVGNGTCRWMTPSAPSLPTFNLAADSGMPSPKSLPPAHCLVKLHRLPVSLALPFPRPAPSPNHQSQFTNPKGSLCQEEKSRSPLPGMQSCFLMCSLVRCRGSDNSNDSPASHVIKNHWECSGGALGPPR